MLLASLTVTLSLYFSGERHGGPSAGNQVLYVWIALYSGYFFSMVGITAQLGAIAGLYGGVLLVIDPGSVALTRWLITVGMVSAAAVIVHALKRRNDDLLRRLAKAARTDSLTGLVNRQAFDERLEIDLARGRRTERPMALVIADIDHFKEINDRFGHAVGDAALRTVGETARQAARVPTRLRASVVTSSRRFCPTRMPKAPSCLRSGYGRRSSRRGRSTRRW